MMQIPILTGAGTGGIAGLRGKLRTLAGPVLAVLALVAGEGRFATAAGPDLTARSAFVHDAGVTARTLWRAAGRPWPFNGQVTNAWDRTLEAWSDTRGSFLVAPGTGTGSADDVDYVNVDGQWYKIGIHHTRIDRDGQVTGYECLADSAGGPCF